MIGTCSYECWPEASSVPKHLMLIRCSRFLVKQRTHIDQWMSSKVWGTSHVTTSCRRYCCKGMALIIMNLEWSGPSGEGTEPCVVLCHVTVWMSYWWYGWGIITLLDSERGQARTTSVRNEVNGDHTGCLPQIGKRKCVSRGTEARLLDTKDVQKGSPGK